MFGHKAGPSIVYEYGCQAPTAGQAVFDAQIRLAHRYRNKLVEIERERRAAVRQILDATAPANVQAVADLEAGLIAAIAEAKQARQCLRSKAIDPVMRERIVGLKAALKEARAAAKAARRAGLDAVKPRLAEIDEAAAESVRQTRAASGLYWGTYLAVEQGMDRARRGSNDPRFRRFDGSGRIAVQLQNGLATAAVFGDDRRLQIDPVQPAAWTHPSRGERRRLCRTVVRVRAGSDDGAPVWVELPVSLHRSLPEGAIKWAHLFRDRVGTQYRYRLQLVIELPAVPEAALGEGTVALDVGWRLVDDGLRVAYWRDDRGGEGSLVLDQRLLAAFRQTEELQSIRDDNFNVARGSLARWLAGATVPEWLAEATATLAQWRSCGRLAGLVLRWREQRFGGDEESFARLEAWRKQDKHLLEWQANLRAKALARRRDIYRVFVSDLRRRYRRVIVEDFDLREVARREGVDGQKSELHEAARRQRQIAAVSQLRGILQHSGLEVQKVESAWTTQTCWRCGQREEFDAAAAIVHTCRQCGATWDQDANAARRLLAASTGGDEVSGVRCSQVAS